jgi:hypothetical protein
MPPKPVPKSDTKKGNTSSDKKKPLSGVVNLDDDWLYHSKK